MSHWRFTVNFLPFNLQVPGVMAPSPTHCLGEGGGETGAGKATARVQVRAGDGVSITEGGRQLSHSLNLISRAKIKRYPGDTVMSVKNMPPERDHEVSAD